MEQHMNPRPRTNGTAVGSFILSLLGVSLPALVMGLTSLRDCRREGQTGEGLALAAIWLGAIGTAGWCIGFFAWYGPVGGLIAALLSATVAWAIWLEQPEPNVEAWGRPWRTRRHRK